jgi:regulatory protein YycI of two-component signal transduction system YycFG
MIKKIIFIVIIVIIIIAGYLLFIAKNNTKTDITENKSPFDSGMGDINIDTYNIGLELTPIKL